MITKFFCNRNELKDNEGCLKDNRKMTKLVYNRNEFFKKTVEWAIPFNNHTGGWTNFFCFDILVQKTFIPPGKI